MKVRSKYNDLVTEDARPWALRFCVDPSGLVLGGWLYDDMDMDVPKNRGTYPKMDCENNGKPY